MIKSSDVSCFNFNSLNVNVSARVGRQGEEGGGGVVVVKREEKKQYLCKLDELIKRMLITLSNDGNLKSGEEEAGK